MRRAVLAGSVIAVVRVGLFWGALTLYTGNADLRQVAGYLLLLLNSLVELGIASVLNHNRPGAPLLVAGLIVLTSFALGWAWARIRFRSSVR